MSRIDLPQVVSNLRALRVKFHGLFQFDLCRVKAANEHQVAAQQSVRVGILDLELE